MVRFLLVFCGVVCFGAETAEAAPYRPHKAYYTLTLVPSGKQVLSAYNGAVAYHFSMPDCKNYHVSLETADHIVQKTGESRSVRTKIEFQEALNGRTYRVHSLEDDGLSDKQVGEAFMEQQADQFILTVEKPTKTLLSQPVKLEFPVGRSQSLLEAARTGEAHYAGYVYEGGQSITEFFYVFSSIIKETTDTRVLSQAMIEAGMDAKMRSWQINSSYYKLDFAKDKAISGDRRPDFSLKETYFDNGLVGDGVYVIDGTHITSTLSGVEWLEIPEC